MLKRLTIKNVALIDRAEIEFSEGLNVLTGETGAGKSVILDSIDFVLGAKADKTMVRSGEAACLVQAEFSVSEEIRGILDEYDIEPEETVVISRKLTSEGKGTLKVNGVSVTAAMLRRITSLLVDVHGQSEHFFLLKEANQLRLLDSIGGEKIAERKEAVQVLLAERKTILNELSKLGGDEGERTRRADILRYQIDEIERIAAKEGEEEELRALQTRYRNAARILEGLSAARDELMADGGGADVLRSARRALNSISKFEPRCEALAERLAAAAEELDDIGGELEAMLRDADVDEREVERVENRLDELKALKKKYGATYSDVMQFLARAKEEYELLVNSEARMEMLEKQLDSAENKLFAACLQLTAARKETAENFTERVVAELKTLAIPSARFEVQFHPYSREDIRKTTSEGLDNLCFLFSANAGEPLKELGKIISGGEMSRFMLAVKASISSAGSIGTYIFDEIDAGIGGKTAQAVAEMFAKISRNVQLIAVTHLARIASFAEKEFLIEKHEGEGKTFTRIREVRDDARLSELARLIGGEGEEVLAYARTLLQEAAAYKNSL